MRTRFLSMAQESAPSSQPTILVIENDATCPAGLVGEWLLEDGFRLEVLTPHDGAELPLEVADDVAAVLALGGVIGAHDDDDADWLPAERTLLRNAVESGVPVLGICLGGQLLAAANGGTVSVSDVTEIGVTEVHRTMDGLADPVVSAARAVAGDTVPAVQWHLDHVAQLPDGAVLLMTNDACHVQAFRLGETAYGLQMHPEVDLRIFTDWIADSPESVPRTDRTASEALETVRERRADLDTAWRPAIRSWGDLVWMRARALGTVTGA